MPFAKGNPKPANSGRKKGTGNRATVAAILEKFKCNPIEGLIGLAMDDKQKAEVRLNAYKELADRVWPKLRALEVSGPGGDPLEMAGDVTVTIRYDDKPKP